MSEADTTVGQLVEPAAEEVTAPVEDPSTGDGATQPAGEEEKEAGNPAAPDTDAAAATAAAVAARLIQQHEEQAGAVYGSNPYDVSQTAAGFEGFPGPDGADGNNKRPRDGEGVEHEEDGPDKKRASTNFLSSEGQAAPENPGGAEGEAYGNPGPGLGDFSTSTTASTVFDIPANMVGKLIGRSGETIRNLQLSTDTRIQVDHEGGGDTRRITITGMTQDQVDRCRREVEGLTGEEEVQETMECPAGIVGRIIGRGGETIRALQSASQAHITVDQNFPEGQPRKVIISGTADAARRAVALIQELIVGEAGSAQAIIQRVCAENGIGKSHSFTVPKGIVGRIIGRGGETIKQIQRASQATIQIDQGGDPCNVTIAGQPAAAEAAKRMVEDIVNGLDPFAGGRRRAWLRRSGRRCWRGRPLRGRRSVRRLRRSAGLRRRRIRRCSRRCAGGRPCGRRVAGSVCRRRLAVAGAAR
ncbi:CRB1 [Auxenochlorella protothecoides x Auxenochlorella symbiontica]